MVGVALASLSLLDCRPHHQQFGGPTGRQVSLLVALTIVASAFVLSAAGKPPAGSALGAGTVFLPNPVADLGDETLTDQKDADYAALAPAYHDVVLTNLDGSGFLVGDWAQVVSETGDPGVLAVQRIPLSPTTTTASSR